MLCKRCGKEYKFSERAKNYELCKTCKIKQVKLEKYGNENYNNPKKNKETCLKKYGVENCSQLEEVKEKKKLTCLKNYGVTAGFADVEKFKKTFQKKYGVDFASQLPQTRKAVIKRNKSKKHKEKVKNTLQEKYGVSNAFLLRKTCSPGGIHYEYDNIIFDSSWELITYIWLKDNNYLFEYHPNKYFEYKKEEKICRFYPDYFINDQYVEIKGDHFFKNNRLYNPWSKNYEDEKMKCITDNNIKLLTRYSLKTIFKEFFNKYGSNYINQFRKKK